MRLSISFIVLFILFSCESKKNSIERTLETFTDFEGSVPNDYFCAIRIIEQQDSSNFILIEENVLFDILKKTRGISLNPFKLELEKLKSNEIQFRIKDSVEYKLLNPYLINSKLCDNDSIANNIINLLKKNKQIVRDIITDIKCTVFILCQNNFKVRQDDESGSFVILNPPLHPPKEPQQNCLNN